MSALSPWNTDIKSAPHGRYEVRQRREGVDVRVFIPQRVILSTKCGKVVLSHYLPEEKRWLMLGKGEQPLAWMPWPEPFSRSALPSASNGKPGIPSLEDDGAKMAGFDHPDRAAQAGITNVNSGQAVTHFTGDA